MHETERNVKVLHPKYWTKISKYQGSNYSGPTSDCWQSQCGRATPGTLYNIV